MNDMRKPETGNAVFSVQNGTEPPFLLHLKGRDRWALESLMQAGPTGCTPIDHPGPRWSGYVFNLRQAGVTIETLYEAHDGPYRGTHARYVLHSTVKRADLGEVAA